MCGRRRVQETSASLSVCARFCCPTRAGAGLYPANNARLEPHPHKNHQACPSGEIDRLYFLEAHRDGVIVAHIFPPGAAERALAGFVCRSVGGRSPTRGLWRSRPDEGASAGGGSRKCPGNRGLPRAPRVNRRRGREPRRYDDAGLRERMAHCGARPRGSAAGACSGGFPVTAGATTAPLFEDHRLRVF